MTVDRPTRLIFLAACALALPIAYATDDATKVPDKGDSKDTLAAGFTADATAPKGFVVMTSPTFSPEHPENHHFTEQGKDKKQKPRYVTVEAPPDALHTDQDSSPGSATFWSSINPDTAGEFPLKGTGGIIADAKGGGPGKPPEEMPWMRRIKNKTSLARIKSLTFGGPVKEVYDDGGSLYQAKPEQGHWFDFDDDGFATTPAEVDKTTNAIKQVKDHRYPVSYKQTDPLNIQELLIILPETLAGKKIWVRGKSSDGKFTFDQKLLIAEGKKLKGSFDAKNGEKFPEGVFFCNPLILTWEMAEDKDGTPGEWATVGSTDNRIYGRLGDPVSDPISDSVYSDKGNSLFETPLHIACNSATTTKDKDHAFQSIWDKFKTLNVSRKSIDGYNMPDNQQMSYWADAKDVDLLKYVGLHGCQNWLVMINPYDPRKARISQNEVAIDGIGTCGAWGGVFSASCRSIGIDGVELVFVEPESQSIRDKKTGVLISTNHSEHRHLMVKNWRFSDAPKKERPGQKLFLYFYEDGDYEDLDGIPAQSIKNPKPSFPNHMILSRNGTLYDPSYGVSAKSSAEYQTLAIAGTGVWTDNKRDLPLRATPAGKEKIIVVYTYIPNSQYGEIKEIK